MRRIILLLITVIASTAVSCEKIDTDGLEVQNLLGIAPKSLDLTKSQVEMTEGINRFAYDLYREVFEDRDIFISPFSMSLALSMLTTGADANTEKQLLSALGFDGMTAEDLGAYYSRVMGNMASSDPSTTLAIANAIWSDKDIVLKDSFVETCGKYFDSAAGTVDFSDPSTLKKLNDWTSEHTGGKIEKMFDEFSPVTKVVLANATSFNATWPFDFTRSGDRMLAKVLTTYFEGKDFSGVQVPYGNGSFAMRIILPSRKSSLKSAVKELDNGGLRYPDVTFESAIVSLNLPVFSFSYENGQMKDALMGIGIVDAFNSGLADFSKMSDSSLYVDDVKHKTYVDFNEKGTDAAALTVISMFVSSPGPSGEEKPAVREVRFNVDRDFIFEIIDLSSNLTVFMGQHKM